MPALESVLVVDSIGERESGIGLGEKAKECGKSGKKMATL
jgi:hypothetical protein